MVMTLSRAADLAFSIVKPIADNDKMRLILMAKEGMRIRFLLKQWEIDAEMNN